MAWATTDDGLRFAMYNLQRWHNLNSGWSTGLQTSTWRQRGEVIGTLNYQVVMSDERPYIRLTYNWRDKPQDYKIYFTFTTPRYGGKRWWFLCPITGARCAVLYSPAGQPYFASRKAFKLKYESQKESRMARFQRRYHKLSKRYGADDYGDGWFLRPKGMHLKTYYRRLRELDFWNSRVEAEFMCWGRGHLGVDLERLLIKGGG